MGQEIKYRTPMIEYTPITNGKVQAKLRKMKILNAPGPDQLNDFWLKKLAALQPLSVPCNI